MHYQDNRNKIFIQIVDIEDTACIMHSVDVLRQLSRHVYWKRMGGRGCDSIEHVE
jgi:hypothetical protein